MVTFGHSRVTNELPVSTYRHLPDAGYMSLKFVRSLFPNFVLRRQPYPNPIPFIELQHFEDSIDIHFIAASTITAVQQGRYQDIDVDNVPLTLTISRSPLLIPPHRLSAGRCSTRQCQQAGELVSSSKPRISSGPDRRDLHHTVLDQYAINHLTGLCGFDKAKVSVKDFVWVYDLKPIRQALREPEEALTASRYPRTTALHMNSAHFFRAESFAFVTPVTLPEPILEDIREDNFVMANSRANVSCAMRFSKPPAFPEARTALYRLVRQFLPMHPDEGSWVEYHLSSEDSLRRNPFRPTRSKRHYRSVYLVTPQYQRRASQVRSPRWHAHLCCNRRAPRQTDQPRRPYSRSHRAYADHRRFESRDPKMLQWTRRRPATLSWSRSILSDSRSNYGSD
uniref:Uncharacterized protein n=1 Tax=Haemonchus placei TaxID=6290 RepID=A0A0N4WG73_HAEPC